jgi:hypothetical protein
MKYEHAHINQKYSVMSCSNVNGLIKRGTPCRNEQNASNHFTVTGLVTSKANEICAGKAYYTLTRRAVHHAPVCVP